ncbi:hypothetical protein G3T14_10130 [Methylobacterium sp. BTF04]|uniref:hypothetical protein n=1 Tax=Methylobacterium sp. BTF04 TaxID=2708300 RepID=UPI0013D4ADFE|nr:hypothetical protein [Methylobacterium sp. BTF04]NEU12492.1 hypothetical protein [Methylobacterium sp. BTF04]
MKKITFAFVAATLLGGLAVGGAATAAPMGPNGMQGGNAGMTQVRMMESDRMMMKKRMMKKRMMKRQMMKRQMMKKRMMNRGM